MIDTQQINARANLYDLAASDTRLSGGPTEWFGPCPRCGGENRFHVHRDKGWFCRRCTGEPDGVDGHWHDAIDYIQWRDGVSFVEACNRLGGDTRMTPAESAALLAERTRREQERRAAEAQERANRREVLDKSEAWRVFHENLDKFDKRHLWHERGLSDLWIDYFRVGYCPKFTYRNDDSTYTAETLTIPAFQPELSMQEHWSADEPVSVLSWRNVGLVHRILADKPPGGKYRPHMAGLGKSLFLCDQFDTRITGPVLLVEGEIKAMVTWAHVQSSVDDDGGGGNRPLLGLLNVVGIAGASFKISDAQEFKDAAHVVICLDPDAQRQAESIAQAIGPDKCSIVSLPDKIDDMLLAGTLKIKDLFLLAVQAKKV